MNVEIVRILMRYFNAILLKYQIDQINDQKSGVCLLHVTPVSNCLDLSNSNKVGRHVVRCSGWSAVHLSYRSNVSVCSFVEIVVVIPSP